MSILLKLKVKATGRPLEAGQDHFWRVMRTLDTGGPWSVSDVLKHSRGASRDTLKDYVRRLVKGGYLVISETLPDGSRLYRIERRSSRAPSVGRDGSTGRQGTINRQLWTAIRSLGAFSYRELIVAASTEEVPIRETTARDYLKRLCDAGYLRIVDASKPGIPRTYALKRSMNTGPDAPKVLRTKLIWDPNREEIIGETIAEEERS